ncbi:hypothetical protein [Oceanibacterium hippocampi]|uniref:Spermidine synthase n=1 Tax=Oceanibacterium hippocampi TaxID=745714 RepID=A0A1Y5S0B3_9PROT|nr:hypothetical protein [Oceanibacterium hippocampi]SLN27046.1 spermidine synthase [Oceanibacterium hippocampi]
MRRISCGIFLIAFVTLVSELLLIRVFDVILTANIGYMIITCAMFSLGLGGIYLVLFPNFLQGEPRKIAVQASIGYALTLALFLPICNALPFDYEDIAAHPVKQLLAFLGVYLALMAPFFAAGLIFSKIFSFHADKIGRLYFFDLVGAGVGCVAFVPFLPLIGPGGLLIAAGGMALLAGAMFATTRVTTATLAVAGLALMAVPAVHAPAIYDFDFHVDKRGVRTAADEGRIEFSRWDPISRIDVVRPSEGDSGDLGPNRFHVAYDGGTQSTHFYKFDGDYDALRRGLEDGSVDPDQQFWFLSVAASHYLKRDSGAEVLVIGSAGGQEAKAALTFGAASVDAVEMVGTVTELAKGPYADYIGNLFNDSRVRTVRGEGRSFLRAREKRYDIIQIFSNHTSSSIASGTGAMQTTYLQTAGAYVEYFSHLKPDGVLQINHHVFPRMITTAALAWKRMGLTDFQRHVAIFEREVELDAVPTLLIKMTPWTAEELDDLQGFLAKSPQQVQLIENPTHPQRSFLPASFYSGDYSDEGLEDSPIRLYPSTDDRPFFNYLRASLGHVVEDKALHIDRSTAGIQNSQLRRFVPTDIIHLVVTTISAFVFALIFILLPMRFAPVAQAVGEGRASFIAYFACLGFGFIVLELTLVQIFMELIGPPLHTFSTVLFSMLLFSGIGSLAGTGLRVQIDGRWWLPFAGIAVCGLLLVLFYEPFIQAGLVLPLTGRILLTVAAVAPLSFFLGMPFPLGVSALAGFPRRLVAWAWAINGLFTVIGGIASVLLALYLGFEVTMTIAFSAYLLACSQVLLLRRGHFLRLARGLGAQVAAQ